jgi:hypothetical protein
MFHKVEWLPFPGISQLIQSAKKLSCLFNKYHKLKQFHLIIKVILAAAAIPAFLRALSPVWCKDVSREAEGMFYNQPWTSNFS